MLIAAIVLITGALGLYTAGVWSEHRAGTLGWTHVVLFALGFALDSAGTVAMSVIARGSDAAASGASGLLTQVMAVTGAIALALMAAHLAWALVVLWRDRPTERLLFHRLSLAVWGVWLLPYVTGMAGSML